MTMKRVDRDNWADALESGLFKQGSGMMRNNKNEACCLGVLAQVLDPQGWSEHTRAMSVSKWSDDHKTCVNVRMECYAHHGDTSMPSTKLLHQSGLSYDTCKVFARYNDTNRMTFGEIAKKVRALPVRD